MERKGFTLIEILIVVAIIAILASIVLVGLGPTQALGRDSRRLSDLQEVQNALELYYNANGYYPGGGSPATMATGAAWGPAGTTGALSTVLTTANIGVNSIPNDPSGGTYMYVYAWSSTASSYVMAADMESTQGSEWASYQVPSGLTASEAGGTTGTTKPTCLGNGTALGNGRYQYCLSL